MIGTILAGGQSSRMGQDKGLMEFKGKKWAEVVNENLISLSIPTVISIRQEQLTEYSRYFKEADLIIDNPDLKIHGPLAGLMTVHLKFPKKNVLAVACDMINLESVVIEKLISEFQQREPEAIAFEGEHIEPLCAIYSAGGLKKIISSYYEHTLKKHSLIHVLENLETIYLPIKEGWQSFFKNFNEKADLN